MRIKVLIINNKAVIDYKIRIKVVVNNWIKNC